MTDERPREPAPVDDLPVPPRALGAVRRPGSVIWVAVTGFGMGMAEVVPGFSGGTVALVAGVYERLIAVFRQGARAAALALRGRAGPAASVLVGVDWVFALVLLSGMLAALFTTAPTLQQLIEERPAEVSAAFLGLVLGAAVVAARYLVRPTRLHGLLALLVGGVVFLGLGLTPGTIPDPGLATVFLASTVAVCAWILPGVSGSFLLLLIGVYGTVVGAVADRDLVVLGVVALGCVTGLAAFSTLLNWLLARYHDLVLAALIGLMIGSVRVLWPWPSDEGIGSARLAPPPGAEAMLEVALALAAFGAVWIFGLAASALLQRTAARHAPEPAGGDEAG